MQESFETPLPGASSRGAREGRTSRRRGSAGPTPGSAADQTPEADPHEVARSIVLRQLSMAPRSRHQLHVKLLERGVPEEVAVQVLDRYEEVQLVDDAEFARMWVRSRAQTRSLARSAIKRELAEKGITGDLAEDALSQRTDEDERDAAEQLVRRKLRPLADPSDPVERDKQVRRLVSMLARKGYGPSVSFAIVKDILDSD
ncbi:regulatory protein RecX [Arthrobacter sp. JZ12]|uniref:regulatory protein RecX n=1 Tax=Arthrobacter sp. JZ12 TaxID=2654190 RepID=UPI002B4A73F3|nr:regulatory protein RecX [Arthrobacter sp. JZ12]WRH24632.1 regulatory protein RecX [Arthrobacter sp. JZ12]